MRQAGDPPVSCPHIVKQNLLIAGNALAAPFTSLSSPVLHNNLTIERNLIDGKGPAAYY